VGRDARRMIWQRSGLARTVAFVAAALLASSDRVAAIEDAMAVPPLVQGHVRAIALDAAGNRYLAGFFFGEVDFHPGIGLDARTSVGESDLFLTRFNADGSYGWTRTFGGSEADEAAAVMVAGKTVFVAGTFASADAGVAHAGGRDAIVLAFDTASSAPITGFGQAGAQTFGGAGEDEATALAFSGKTLYVAGGFTSTNAGIGSTGRCASAGDVDAFVLALSAARGLPIARFGNRGVQTLAGLNIERATALAIAGATLYVGGYLFADSTGIGKPGIRTGIGGLDAFVMALDRNTGRARRAFGGDGLQLVGGTGNDLGFAIAASPGAVHLAGTFESADAGIGAAGEALSAGGFDAFVAALNVTTGAAHPFFGIGGIQTFGGSDDDVAGAMATSGNRLHVAGAFKSNNAGIGRFGTMASGGGSDAFLLQLDAFTGGAFDFDPVTFGGSADDAAFGMAATVDAVFATGSSLSPDTGIGGSGPIDATPWSGFMLALGALANDAAALTGADSDGDDFPDEVEAALGTSPDLFIRSPAGFDAGPAGVLQVRSLSIKLDFATPDPARDTIVLRGRVPISAGFRADGQPVVVSVGGVVRRFALNARGVAVNSGGSFVLRTKKKNGAVPAQEASFTAVFRRNSFRALLDDESLPGDATIAKPGEPRAATALVMIDGAFFRAHVDLQYTAVAGRSGTAKTP
jgi:hypothetical protein